MVYMKKIVIIVAISLLDVATLADGMRKISCHILRIIDYLSLIYI
jgi:hypothetical protein